MEVVVKMKSDLERHHLSIVYRNFASLNGSTSSTDHFDISHAERIQERIDVEIRAHLDAIITLHRRRNEYSKISRLPFEILVNIFGRLSNPSRKSRWFTVTHVCRVWREAALACPTLWTHINTSRLSQALEFCNRSKAALLDVCIPSDSRYSLPSHIADYILGNFQRIRDLRLMNELTIGDERLALLNSPAWGEKWTALKAVAIYTMPVQWNFSWLVGLTRLSLVMLHVPITVSELLDILAQSPDLEFLELRDAGPVTVSKEKVYCPSIHLAHLKNMVVEADAEAWAQTMTFLDTPNLLLWNIKCNAYPMNGLIDLIPSTPTVTSQLQALEIVICGKNMTLTAKSCSTDALQQKLSIRTLERATLSRIFFELARMIGSCGSWSQVVELSLTVDCTVGAGHVASWSALFGSMPQLHCISYDNKDASLVTDESLAIALGTHDTLRCPKLRELHLSSIYFSPQGLSAWLNSLSQRYEHGSPVLKLNLKDCAGIEVVLPLEEWVEEVNWVPSLENLRCPCCSCCYHCHSS